MLMPSVCFIL